MKKKVTFLAAIVLMSIFMVGFRSKAAETVDYYEVVKDGVWEDIQLMEEEEDTYTVLSVKFEEQASEKVCAFDVDFISEEEQYRLWIYLDKGQDEAIAILYTSDGEVHDRSHMSLTEAAKDYM